MKNQIEELIKIAENKKGKNVPLFSYTFENGFKNPATIGNNVYFQEEHTYEEKKILEHLKLAKFWLEEIEKTSLEMPLGFVNVNVESANGEDLGKVSYIPLPHLQKKP